MLSYLKRLITGELGLPKTFWLFGIVGNLAITMAFALRDAWLTHLATTTRLTEDQIWLLQALSVTTWGLGVAYQIIVVIAIVTAAVKYKGRSIWPALAVGFVLLSVGWAFLVGPAAA